MRRVNLDGGRVPRLFCHEPSVAWKGTWECWRTIYQRRDRFKEARRTGYNACGEWTAGRSHWSVIWSGGPPRMRSGNGRGASATGDFGRSAGIPSETTGESTATLSAVVRSVSDVNAE